MQKQLGFQRISADTAQKQRDHIATKWMEEHPLFPASDPAPQPKRKPGRPPKLPQKLAASPDPAPPAKKARTGHYTNWFTSPYINDVLQALERHSYNFKRAVDWLKQHAPDGRFQRLSDSTVRAWFEKGTHSLLPSFQQQLNVGQSLARGGRPSQLSPAMEEQCKHMLLQLRDTGLPVNSHVIRWTLRAVFSEHCPALLQNMQLSQQWISAWVRSKLQWRWRSRTTAASKLPIDWEQQGVQMAKRVAYRMGMINVSTHQKSACMRRTLRLLCCALTSNLLFVCV